MQIPITNDLVDICTEIIDKNYSNEMCSEIESDDMFQVNNFVGGFDADENEFCFSYTASNNSEYWFQFSLDLAHQIFNGSQVKIIGRLAG